LAVSATVFQIFTLKARKWLNFPTPPGRTYATVLRLSVCTECIVAKRCVLEQKVLLAAYRKSYMRNRLAPKWMTLTFV